MDVEYDQHFLVNEKIIKKTIKEANIDKNDIIVEIGPGKGVLTKEILKQNIKSLTSIEIDKNFESVLKDIKKDFPVKFNFIFDNALNQLSNIDFNKLIANIPYAITEPLYEQILVLRVPCVIMLHGNRFYKILNDNTSIWHYFVNAYYNVELLEEVEGNNFEPKTKVKSALVKLELKTDLSKIDLLIQNLFNKRTRSVKNAVKFAIVDTYGVSKKSINLESIDNIVLNKVLKDLSREEFRKVIDYFSQASHLDK